MNKLISLLRLDERMIHGQVAIKWSRYLCVDRIVVVSDAAAGNPVIKKSLMMAAPATAKTTIRGVDDSIALLNDPRGADHKILVIVSTPSDLLRIIENVPEIKDVNVGNYGRIASKEGTNVRKTYRPNFYAYDSEMKIFKKIIDHGVNCYYQTTPEDPQENMERFLNKENQTREENTCHL